MQLAELKQDREVKAEIYSNILVRFNEAKIADAVDNLVCISRLTLMVVSKNVPDDNGNQQ